MQEGQNVQISQGIAKRHKDGSSAAQNGLFKQGGGGGTKSSLHLLHPLDKPRRALSPRVAAAAVPRAAQLPVPP